MWLKFYSVFCALFVSIALVAIVMSQFSVYILIPLSLFWFAAGLPAVVIFFRRAYALIRGNGGEWLSKFSTWIFAASSALWLAGFLVWFPM
jgi:NADH:ubiquinone oxidoreductase subunit K